jgi:hypothetical protein
MNLAAVYDEYISLKADKRDRDPLRLFCTDVGRCPKAVALRMLQSEKKPIGLSEARNQRLMWELAEHIEENLAAALRHKKLLGGYQDRVEILDRENWGGRLDILTTEPRVIEVKTIRPNAFRFNDRPKKEHVYQAVIYQHYLDHVLPPVLAYFDRGGANTPEQYDVSCDWTEIAALMDELDSIRAGLPELPDILSRVLKRTDRGKNVRLVPDWRCGYCDYAGTSCRPHEGTEMWVEGDAVKAKADLGALAAWAEAEADEALKAVLA